MRVSLKLPLIFTIAAALAACGPDPNARFQKNTPAMVGGVIVPVVEEAFETAMVPEDNIDSPTAWTTPEGDIWLIASAKSNDRLMVYDGSTGMMLKTIGRKGKGELEFDRPNGVAVVDNLLFVVERDNHRVQVLELPGFNHVATFGSDELVKPYGLWVNAGAGDYSVYVTDAYDDGEDANGDDILPPLEKLDRHVPA